MSDVTDEVLEPSEWYSLGLDRLEDGKYPAAREAFRNAVRLGYENEADAWVNIARTHLMDNQIEECESALRRAIHVDSYSDIAWNNLALVLLDQDRVQEAEEAARNSLRLNPERGDSWWTLGMVLEEAVKQQEAFVVYATALGLNPGDAQKWVKVAQFYHRIDDEDEAECYLDIALSIDPDCVEAMYWLAEVHRKEGNMNDAAKYYNKTLDLVPDHVNALTGSALMLIQLGRPEEAERFISSALEVDEVDFWAWLAMGRAKEQQGILDEAEKSYRLAIRIKPHYSEANRALAEFLESHGREEEAEEHREEFRRVKETNSEKSSEIDASIAHHIKTLNLMNLRTWGSCSGLDVDHPDREAWRPYVSFAANRQGSHHHLLTIADVAGWKADYGVNGFGVEMSFGAGKDDNKIALAWDNLVQCARHVMSLLPKTYDDLFEYVALRCGLREENGKTVWGCGNDLTFTKEFCEENGLDFRKIKERLNDTGGYCDCEVLLNSMDTIPRSEKLPPTRDAEAAVQ